jgi:hypothetical protein
MRSHRILLPLIALTALSVSACSEQLDQAANDVASKALERAITSQLDNYDVGLKGDPDCSTDFERNGTTLTGDASCDGTTSDGKGVTAKFDGTLSTSECSGSLTVQVDGETVADMAEIPDCSVNL